MKVNLKYLGMFITEVVTAGWEKHFYGLKMVSIDILSFLVGGS